MEQRTPFVVVGVGASAGGLAALEHLLKPLTPTDDLAFIIIMHLPRTHRSALVEILARATAMPVHVAVHDAEVLPGCIHVGPPDHTVTMRDGRLVLHPRTEEVPQRPIDLLLCSLAEDCHETAVGVLLSGSGSDGTLGLQVMKQQGGLTVAQGASVDGPQYDSMPHSAVVAGVVDLELPVDQIVPRLIAFAQQLKSEGDAKGGGDDSGLGEAKTGIYRLLLEQVGHDFSGYKEKSFGRRVRRRMQVRDMTSPADYAALLQESSDEVRLLFRDLLIGVTCFFRDPDAFSALEKLVIPRLFENKGPDDQVRIWVPGCASGEEVYSLAILVLEHLQTLKQPPRVQFFGTDIDAAALTAARQGSYPAPLVNQVSPARLKRFFSGGPTSYVVNKQVRELCIFSLHSVVRDPPFSRLDLISCRNLLIYFSSAFQNQVIPAFHFALRPGGFVFLGSSENVSQHGDYFEQVDRQHRIFKRSDKVKAHPRLVTLPLTQRLADATVAPDVTPAGQAAALRGLAEARILDRFAPAHVLINGDGMVLHFSARTGRYLEAATGQPNRHLLSMARSGLRLDLRAALHEAIDTGRAVSRGGITLEFGDQLQLVDLTVEPLAASPEGTKLFLVVLADASQPFEPQQKEMAPTSEGVQHLELELRETRERLQTTIEEYEGGVEELKTSNEELQSTNEEMQSANEELETSKEELQSINEELHTVNSELTVKVEEVHRAHSDLRNVFESTQVATVFLNETLQIRSFTPAMTGIFNLIPSDRGRPLTDIVNRLDDSGDLKGDIEAVFRTGEPVERRVHAQGGIKHYLMRILPYRSSPPVIDGALLVFVDIARLMQHEVQQQVMVEELNHRVRNMLAMVTALARQVLRHSGSLVDFESDFLDRIQAIAKSHSLISNHGWGDVELRTILTDAVGMFQVDKNARFTLKGPVVHFNSSTALTLGMMLHELATNAAKYGALSVPDGEIAVNWRVLQKGLDIAWVESGGPSVNVPERTGFGSILIKRLMDAGFGGEATFDYRRHGLRVDMLLPNDDTVFTVGGKATAA